jgi:hypothetical protein
MRFSPLSARLSCLLIVLALVAVVGCGPSDAKMTGKVTYKGEALKGGTVTLIPKGTGQTFSTRIEEDGSYNFDQIKSGTYKVCVETDSLKPPPASKGPSYFGKQLGVKDKSKIKNTPPKGVTPPEGYLMSTPFSGASENDKRYVAIPKEYGDAGTTTLTVDVKGGSQQHDIPLG